MKTTLIKQSALISALTLFANASFAGQYFVGGSLNLSKNTTDYKGNNYPKINIASGKDSKYSPQASLIGGYKTQIGNFNFISEAGFDLASAKVGKKSKNQMEVKKGLAFNISQKVGYVFKDASSIYATAGITIAKHKFNHKELKISDETLAQPFLGLGSEVKVSENLFLFSEFNFILTKKVKFVDFTKKEIGTIKIGGEQFKIGARYYL